MVGLVHPWKWMVYWMAGELALWFWKKGTQAAIVGNREDGGTGTPLEVNQCPTLEVHGILDSRGVASALHRKYVGIGERLSGP